MAENKPQAPNAQPQAMTDAERAELEQLRAERDAQMAAAQAAPEATEKMDETIPGGAYRVGDQLVNAEGQPIDAKGNVKKGE